MTGAGGFAGRYLVAELEARGHETFRWVRGAPVDGQVGDDKWVVGDLTDEVLVREAVAAIRPDAIFHLAAQASVAESWRDPAETLRVNQLGQLYLIQAALDLEPRPRLLICGSNEEYGIVRPDELPIRETNPLRPANPYAVSKVTQDLMALQYFLSHGLQVVRVRPFNHFGPGQAPSYVIPSIAKQVAELEAGLVEPVIKTGEPSVRRDFTDVRDIVRGYADLIEGGTPGEVYNLGSGRDHSIADLVGVFQTLTRCHFDHQVDDALRRPVDVPVSVCDAGRARSAVGWEPRIPFDASIAAVLDEWRIKSAEAARA
ncbi:MAG TPA: GDP-mannose 4,6-dehydratase [Dehalococcoidia bacterium]|nr:GDP-mannose 4,6-dehydratase [Dehalococcoidia bacterium]